MSDTPDEKTPAQPIGDDLIMPYADGVLAPDQRPAVRDALARDPELMQRFESFLFTRGPLARAFDAVLAAPIPERLLEAVRGPAPQRTRPTASLLGSARLARLADMFRVPDFSPAVAIPAVLVGVAAGWLAHYAIGIVGAGGQSWRCRHGLAPAGPRGHSHRRLSEDRSRLIARAQVHFCHGSANLVPAICLDLRRRPGGRRHGLSRARWRLAGVDVDPAGARRARARPASRRRGPGWQRATKQRKRPRRCPLAFQTRRRPRARKGGGRH